MATLKHPLVVSVIAAATLLFSGCGPSSVVSDVAESGGSTGPIATEGLFQSSQPRNLSPAVTASDVTSLVAGANTFGLNLFKTLNSRENGNIFISPYSVSSALAMVYAGAENNTAKEMAAALSFAIPDEKVFASFNYLDISMQNTSVDSGSFTISIANALWGQTGFSFENEFLDLLSENYGAGLHLLDFSTKPDESRITINRWVENATENRIMELLPDGSISSETRLVVTNAIYFLAEWTNPFIDKSTREALFFRSASDSVAVPTMHQSNKFLFGEFPDCKAITLPYKGGRASMLLLLPGKNIDDFVATLTIGKLAGIESKMASVDVDIAMPKFEFTFGASLLKTLEHLGMKDAFSGSADFSGITRQERLIISDVIHKAFIKVDETKTEAAAATAVIMLRITSAPINRNLMTINRPFVLVIKDEATGTYLFMGKVVDPTVK